MYGSRIVPISQLRASLAFMCGLVASKREPIIIARHKRQDVVLVSRDEWERLNQLQADIFAGRCPCEKHAGVLADDDLGIVMPDLVSLHPTT